MGPTSSGDRVLRWPTVLFDLDGTLTDSRRGIIAGIRHAFATVGVVVGEDHDWRRYLGPPLRDALVANHGDLSPEQVEACVAAYLDYYGSVGKFENDVYEGIPALLDDLRAAGAVLGVATSKRAHLAEDILDHFGLRAYFGHVGGAAPDGSGARKHEVVSGALTALAVRARPDGGPDAVLVGDRHHDVEGAAANHLATVGVAWGYAAAGELDAAGALVVVDSVDALRDQLLPAAAG